MKAKRSKLACSPFASALFYDTARLRTIQRGIAERPADGNVSSERVRFVRQSVTTPIGNKRHDDLVTFYEILDKLEKNIGGTRKLADSSGRLIWPKRGVYFFREPAEDRADSGTGSRIVRVGTHALKSQSSAELWTRLSQHKGQTTTGGGNHRGSIFRLLVGAALIRRDGFDCPS